MYKQNNTSPSRYLFRHARMYLSGIHRWCGLDSRLKRAGMTDDEKYRFWPMVTVLKL